MFSGKELKELVALSKEGTTLILDEVRYKFLVCDATCRLICVLQFYSWYIYPEHERDFGKSVSSAEYVDDVNTDAVVIIDGLTKVESFSVTCDSLLRRTYRTGGSLAGVCVGLSGRRT